MKTIYLVLLFTSMISSMAAIGHQTGKEPSDVVLEIIVNSKFKGNTLSITTRPPNIKSLLDTPSDHVSPLVNGKAIFNLSSSEVEAIEPSDFFGRTGMYFLEKGDRIKADFSGGLVVFSGTGAKKFELISRLEKIDDSLKRSDRSKLLSSKIEAPASLDDFQNWNRYLNTWLRLTMTLLDAYKPVISSFAYNRIKDWTAVIIERTRAHKFYLLTFVQHEDGKLINEFGLSNQDFCTIYDSVINTSISERLIRSTSFEPVYAYEKFRLEAMRKRRKFFQVKHSDGSILASAKDERRVIVYKLGSARLKGEARERFLLFMFTNSLGLFKDVGFTPKIETLLAEYYAEPGFPEYKRIAKQFELKYREKYNRTVAAQFSLTDSKGQTFTNANTKGKLAIFDFWFTGCTGCVQMAPALRKVEEEVKRDTNVVFISVSTDKNREMWLKSVREGKYTPGGSINAYTQGKGTEHDMIKDFFITSYPTLYVVDHNGAIIPFDKDKIDPRKDNARPFIAFLQKQLALAKDGPYVLYDNGKTGTNYSISGLTIQSSKGDIVKVQTDGTEQFSVRLQQSLTNQPAVYSQADKLFVLSDIEGNFEAFRKLLQANKIIDEQYNWAFANGHLVIAGDMFDRGNQVTECLWLIYSLEEKARAAGGNVHFILGNHEIMNLQGNYGYVREKYMANAKLLNKTVKDLYNEDSELGRWLRTKNITEKIGNLLFAHGGFSEFLNRTGLTVVQINDLARPNYANRKTRNESYGDERTDIVMSSWGGPFWTRIYYGDGAKDKLTILNAVDSTLLLHNVNHIITGHTVVADTISVHYGGKVINTDTRHAEGKSEALLIEGGKFYRVNQEGKRVLLFVDERRRKNE